MQRWRFHESLFLICFAISILAFEFLDCSLIGKAESYSERSKRSGSNSPITRKLFSVITLVVSINFWTDRDKLNAFKACQLFSNLLVFANIHIISDVINSPFICKSGSLMKISDISKGLVSMLPSRKSNQLLLTSRSAKISNGSLAWIFELFLQE